MFVKCVNKETMSVREEIDINVAEIRKQFPILDYKVYNKPLVYLDNAATTQKPQSVVDALSRAYLEANGNVHRGIHYMSNRATEAYEGARKEVAEFIHAGSKNEIVFTRGTTESINLVASSMGVDYLQEGDEVIVSTMEHHSNIVPWQFLVERKGVRLRVIPMNDRGELLLEEYEKLFNERTKMVSVTYVSNVLGTINPVKEMIRTAHAHGVPFLVDGAQSVSHRKVDVQDLDCDFFAFSAHKMYGPTGIGVLYGKQEWLEKLPPYQGGGEMIGTVSFEKTTYNDPPYKFEAGTPNYIGAVGLTEAIRFIQSIGVEAIEKYEQQLTDYATEQLKQIEGLTIYGEAEHKTSVISFRVEGVHPLDLATLLDKIGIAVRTGHHCAEPLMHRLGIEGTVRASFAVYNTFEEVDALAAGIRRIYGMLCK